MRSRFSVFSGIAWEVVTSTEPSAFRFRTDRSLDVLYASCEKTFDLLCYRIHRKCPKVNDFRTFGIKDAALNGTKHILHDYSPEVDEYLTIHCCQPEPGYCACVLQAADP